MEQPTVDLWKREKYLVLEWQALGVCLDRLEEQIRAAGPLPTVVVGISRGGLVLATFLANRFAIQDLRVISVVRNLSQGRYSDRREPVFHWIAPEAELTGAHVIVTDDIAGDGGTLELVLERLRVLGPRSLRTAVIVKNVNSRFEPDFYTLESNDWLVFPWEPKIDRGRSRFEVLRP